MLARSLPGRRASSAHLENPLATPLDRALARAVHEVRLLAAVTPVNLQAERVRLAVELERGEAALPRFVYAPSARTDLRRALDAMAEALSGEVDAPLETLYRERIEELSLEARIAESVGLASLGTLASARFSMDDPAISVRCRAIAADWLRIPARPSGPTILSDSEQSGSLLREMQREIGLLRLPFAVRTSPALLSLAATGDTTLWIAEGRPLSAEDVRRIVIHEVVGHALPRTRARTRHPLFSIGTARGADDQEGVALLAEERAGALGDARRRELGARHWAVERMCDGASFADVARALTRDHGWPLARALPIAERVFRGTSGSGPGLGRERVYIGALVRVREHLAEHPSDEATLTSGQVALGAIERMRELGTMTRRP
jgi:hypothetical protein